MTAEMEQVFVVIQSTADMTGSLGQAPAKLLSVFKSVKYVPPYFGSLILTK